MCLGFTLEPYPYTRSYFISRSGRSHTPEPLSIISCVRGDRGCIGTGSQSFFILLAGYICLTLQMSKTVEMTESGNYFVFVYIFDGQGGEMGFGGLRLRVMEEQYHYIAFFQIISTPAMQSSEAAGTDFSNQRKSTLVQLWTDLKHAIFDVLFVVMDKTSNEAEDLTIVSLLNESGIDYIQMMQFPFNFSIIMVWNGGQTLNNIFNFLTGILAINNLMPGINYNAFLVCLYLIIFSIVLVILDIVYVSYSFNKKKFRFTLPLVLLAQIVPLFVTILFIPVTEFLLNIINCSPSEADPNVQILQFFPDVVCFQGAHLVHVSITMFFTSIFVFISTVVAMTLFEPRMTANTIAARRSSDGEVIFIINKIICQFFFSFSPFSDTWIYIVLMFFPALWLFYFYHFHQPYYNRQVGKLYRIFSAYYFWTVLMLTISQVAVLLQFNFEGSMVIWFCGLPFIGMNIAYESKSNIDNLFSSNLKFKSGDELESHLMYVLQLIHDRKKDENANMLLVGYIQKHIETCLQDDCPIKVKKPKKEELLSEMDENCKLLIIQIERMYKQGIKKFPLCTKLHISFALFYMERLHLNAKAYEEFVMAERASPSFVEEFIIYRFKKIIKENLEENKEEENDLIEVIRFDNHVSLCEEAMIQSAKLHKEFWTELSEETPNLQKLNQTGGKIIGIVNTVKQNYNEVRKINSHSPEIIHNYGVYSMFIAQNIAEGKRALAHSKRAYYEKKSKGELLAGTDNLMETEEDNSCVVVSAVSTSMGKILSVNDNFVELSGYLKQEITQKSIEKILPQVMQFYHQMAMTRWLNDSSRLYMKDSGNSYFKQTHKGFVKQKNGFIAPVHYRVNYIIFQQKFHVYFKQEKEFNQNLDFKMFIITDSKGVIKDISSLGYAYFNLSKDNLSSNERYIDEFGINFTQNIYHEDGVVMQINKKPKGQDTIRSAQNTEEMQTQTFDKDQEEFFVRAEKIMMPFDGEEEEEEEYVSKIKNGKKDIGTIFYFEKIGMEKNNGRDIKFDSLDRFGKDILELYEAQDDQCEESHNENQNLINEENPLIESMVPRRGLNSVLSGLIMADKEELKERTFKDYGGRIKTYRLVNNELKRVLEEWGETNSDYDELDEEKVAMSNFQMQKLKNPIFVQKIMSAINSNIQHKQVQVLKGTFFIFMVSLLAACMLDYVQVDSQFATVEGVMDQNMLWVEDQLYISNLMHLYYNLTSQTNKTMARARNLQYALDYQLKFDPDVNVQMEEEDGTMKTVRLNQAMIWLQGHMINIFKESPLSTQRYLVLSNYYRYVYMTFQSYSPPYTASETTTLMYLLVSILVTAFVVGLWMYYAIKIDIKCFDIILWFLDIPVPYVCYLQANASTYIKSRIPVKELIDKGINFHDRNLYIEDYASKGQDDTEDKFNEESKSRKIMIARYKKKTLLSRCECAYLQLIWLLLYALLFFLLYLIALQAELRFYVFLQDQWNLLSRRLLWSCAIPNNLREIIDFKNNNTEFLYFVELIQNKFLNPIATLNLSTYYQELLNSQPEIIDYYYLIFEGNICEFSQYTVAESTICKNTLKGKLEGGITTVFTYYPTITKVEYIYYVDIENSQYNYLNYYILNLFHKWKDAFNQSVATARSRLTVILAMYIIMSLFGFALLWALYLNKLNIRMNQTIQMLNMIPIRMLPKGRRDVRDFFNWIIKEANKNKADQ